MLPLIAIPDPDDAALVFDALNDFYVRCTDSETRNRLSLLLVAARNDMRKGNDND